MRVVNLPIIAVLLLLLVSFQNCGPAPGFSSTVGEGSSASLGDPQNPGQPPGTSVKTCSETLAPGESCSLAIQFSPTVKGIRTGALQVLSNGQVVGEVALSGQGE